MKSLAVFRRARTPVAYEVTLDIETSLVSEYDDWLRDHVREMLSFPGFQAATVYRGKDLTDDHRARRVVVYEVRSRRELDSYLHTHAPRMRDEGVKRFGKRFRASRRIQPLEDFTLGTDLAVLYDQNDISGGMPICGNCRQPVPGRFCVNCGQEDRSFMLSLGELVYDFIGDLFNFDSRFFRTMRPMLLRPGVLTAEYIRGRRQHYLPPVRMYIFVSLVFFFASTLLVDFSFSEDVDGEVFAELDANDNRTPQEVATGRDMTSQERATAREVLRKTEAELGLPAGTLRLAGDDENRSARAETEAEGSGDEIAPAGREYETGRPDNDVNISGFGGGDFEARLERGANALRDDPRAFADAVLQQVPTMMFVFLPLIALVLKLLYIGSARYYVEHLVFTLHFHSAIFVLLLLWLLFEELQEHVVSLQPLSPWLTFAVFAYIPVYLYRSLRCVYGQGHFVTALKYALLFFAYVIAVTMTFAFTILYTFYLQA